MEEDSDLGSGRRRRGKKKVLPKDSQLQLDRALDNRVSGWGWEYGERTDNARLRYASVTGSGDEAGGGQGSN